MRSKDGTPLWSQATASPSMMQERERSACNASTIIGKRSVHYQGDCRVAVLAGNDAEPVVLDLVQPRSAAGGLSRFSETCDE
jgi:hypothetical protein